MCMKKTIISTEKTMENPAEWLDLHLAVVKKAEYGSREEIDGWQSLYDKWY